MKKEIWKNIYGYKNIYQISNFGRVKSMKTGTPKILKNVLVNNGYYAVSLYKNKIQKIHYIHRLVAKAFLLNKKRKPQVNHIDGNKLNNHVTNLEWSTYSEQQIHSYSVLGNKGPSGERQGSSKLTKKDVLKIRKLKAKFSQKEIAKKFNVSQQHIHRILERKSWQHI